MNRSSTMPIVQLFESALRVLSLHKSVWQNLQPAKLSWGITGSGDSSHSKNSPKAQERRTKRTSSAAASAKYEYPKQRQTLNFSLTYTAVVFYQTRCLRPLQIEYALILR